MAGLAPRALHGSAAVPLNVVAAASGAENARYRHDGHRDPISGALRFQPVAGIFPDHDLDQREPARLIDGCGEQMLVPDVVVFSFLLVHHSPVTALTVSAQCQV